MSETIGWLSVGMGYSWGLDTSPALASDYSGMVEQLFLFLVILGGLALILGTETSAFLVRATRRKAIWLLVPVFALLWWGVIVGVIELLHFLEQALSGPETPPPPFGPAPDG